MNERISELRAAGEAAIADAPDTAELEDVRVRFLGRKAELPNLLRGVAQLPPEERGRWSAAPPTRRARRSRRRSRPARAELEAAELDSRLASDVVDVTLPGSPGDRARPPAPAHRHAARDRGHLPRPRLPRDGGPGDRARLLQLRRAQLRRDAPVAAGDGHVLRLRRGAAARAHVADADARDGDVPAAAVRRRPGPHLPARQRRHAHAAVQPGRGPGGRRGRHARRPPGHAARVRARVSSARTAACACARTSSRSPSRASSATSRASTATTASCSDGSRCPLCKGEGWIEILGAGEVDPNVFEYVREGGYDPERHQGFAFGMGIERIAMLQATACPTCACSTTTTCGSWSSSDEGPALLAARLLRPRDRDRRARAPADDDRHEGRGASTRTAWPRSSTSWSAAC